MSGAGQVVPRAEEAAGLGDVRAERAAALLLEQLEVLRREDPEQGGLVGGEVDVHHAVVLEVAADRQVLAHRDPEEREILLGADPREHEQDGRLVRAGGDDHLALGANGLDLPVLDDLDADRAVALEDDALREHAGAHLQVRPVRHRVQVRVGGRPALAVALVDLEAGDPLRAVDVEVGDVLVPGLHRRLEHRVDQRLHRAALRDGERPADAVEGVLAALVVLGALEVREHLVVRPAGRRRPRPSRRSRAGCRGGRSSR